MYDFIISNGTIIDGSGREAYKADIGIADGKIKTIGDLSDSKSKKLIDAKNAIVCPGFIDTHTHSDLSIPLDGRSSCQIRQGVTTQIGGLCGESIAPLNEKSKKILSNFTYFECNPTWLDFDSYAKEMEKIPMGTNFGSLVGHMVLRLSALDDYIVTPNEEELNYMVTMLEDALQAGAFGFSTGFEYNPGKAAEIQELEALCRAVSKYNGVHASHIRNRDKYVMSAISEVIDLSLATGARLQISHLNPKYGRYDNTIEKVYDAINCARKEGCDIAVDVMPVQWGNTGPIAHLPMWAQNLPAEELVELLKTPEGREKLKNNPSPMWQLVAQERWDKIYHCYGVKTAETAGMSFAEIAKQRNCSGWDVMCQLLLDEAPAFSSAIIIADNFDLKDVADSLKDPYTSVVSDIFGMSADGYFEGVISSPNTYDWVPAFFHNFVFGENAVLSLEEAVTKLTSIPAKQYKLNDRGYLYQDYNADITIFRPEDLKSGCSNTDLCAYAKGIQTVFVNGQIAYNEGDSEISCHGKFLRHNPNN